MRRCSVVVLCFLLFLSPLFYLNAIADNGDTIVYVTRTGYAYHREGCGHLRSKIEMTLRDAVVAGYSPCEDCNPPRPDFPYDVATPPPRSGIGSGGTRSSVGGDFDYSTDRIGPGIPSSSMVLSPSPSPAQSAPARNPALVFLDSLPNSLSFVLVILLIPLSWLLFCGFCKIFSLAFSAFARFVHKLKNHFFDD